MQRRPFTNCMFKVGGSAANSIYVIMKKEAGNHTKPLEKFLSSKDRNLVLKRIWTKEVRQIVSAPFFVDARGYRNTRVRECFSHFSTQEAALSCGQMTASTCSLYLSTPREDRAFYGY